MQLRLRQLRSRRPFLNGAPVSIAQVVAVFLLLIPILWLYVGAFRTNLDLDRGGWIPHSFTLTNFRAVFEAGFASALLNSAMVAFSVSIVATIVSIMAAYALARYKFRGSGLISGAVLASQALPGIIILVPVIVLLEKIHLTNSLIGLAIVYLPFGIPISVYMLRAAILSLPQEIEEAAMVDGCSRAGAIRHVVIPLLRPNIIAVAAFTFTLCWGEYLFALSLLTGSSQKTLPLALQNLFNLYTLPIGTILAGGVVVSLPVVVVFLAVQRNLVGGLVSGATKG